MSKCLACEKGGIFLRISEDGLCPDCKSKFGNVSYTDVMALVKKYSNYSFERASVVQLLTMLEGIAVGAMYKLISHKTWIRDSVNPEIFFQHYRDLFTDAEKAIEIGKYFRYDVSPTEIKHEYREKAEEYTNAFLDRWWDSVLNKACNVKTLSNREKKINEETNHFKVLWYNYLPDSCKQHFDDITSMIIDVENMEKKKKEPPSFDIVGESALLDELKNADDVMKLHFAYSHLLEFYYKYRETDEKYLKLCVEYCEKDIGILPAVDIESRKEVKDKRNSTLALGLRISNDVEDMYKRTEKFGFIADIPAFKRLCIIYEKQKEYDKAIMYCNEAIKHYNTHDLPSIAEDFEKRKAKLEKK